MAKLIAIISLCAFFFCPTLSDACSLVDPEATTRDIIRTGYKYWILSALIASFIGFLNYKFVKSKWLYTLPTLIVALHPAWTITPNLGIDCSSMRVMLSKTVVGFLSLIIVYTVYRIGKARRRETPA